MVKFKVIDMHTHFVPSCFPDMTNRSGSWPVMEKVDNRVGNVMISGKLYRTVTDQAWDVERRIEDMDKEGVDIQVVSPMPELLSYWQSPDDTLEFSRFINEQLSELVNRKPNRFFGVGTVPLQDPIMAANELKRLRKEYGLAGVEVGSNINGRSIGDPFFMPFFEAASEENMAIFVHPIRPLGKERLVGPPILQPFVNFQIETGLGAISLITGGILENFPKLRIAISHGGGSFFSILPRLIKGWNLQEELREIMPKHPMEYVKKLYFDNLVYDGATLQHLINLFGTERILVGSDYPFIIREEYPWRILKKLALDRNAEKQICQENSIRFLGIGANEIYGGWK